MYTLFLLFKKNGLQTKNINYVLQKCIQYKLCIATMGSSALDSHSKGKKHAAKVKEHSSMSLDCFFSRNQLISHLIQKCSQLHKAGKDN